ncbi:hypothetical protein MUO14_06690 [Halobacillus shinanisalinarum]|uniref:Uncharacterized protein n=1 Tax=Halobacillus shinanisalinarum TaxID=2932258 RepID=A0ABY4H2E7_9BACI|nr:hypothetical protein [Halobacillus shinanisalinarum]UOQ94631.1 hypothetical protein MUO14_06690 [Halobacillus shinanisalinarum]
MRKKSKFKMFVALAFLIAVIILIGALFLRQTPSQQAKKTVQSFYEYEQEARFAESWGLFHPLMKEKFTKGHYIQDRAHVFMNHFGVTTFSYSLSNMEKVEGWSMTKDADSIGVVYATTVVQTFKGKYGTFDLHQEVFVTEVEGDWLILWDYNK